MTTQPIDIDFLQYVQRWKIEEQCKMEECFRVEVTFSTKAKFTEFEYLVIGENIKNSEFLSEEIVGIAVSDGRKIKWPKMHIEEFTKGYPLIDGFFDQIYIDGEGSYSVRVQKCLTYKDEK